VTGGRRKAKEGDTVCCRCRRRVTKSIGEQPVTPRISLHNAGVPGKDGLVVGDIFISLARARRVLTVELWSPLYVAEVKIPCRCWGFRFLIMSSS